MHDPMTLIGSFNTHLGDVQLWHVDPCKGPGGDDTCGWFKRAHHGNPKVLAKIINQFDFAWDRTFKSDGELGRVYFCGYFCPEDAGAGMPNMGVTAIALNLFFLAANEHFKCDGQSNWKKSRAFMRRNLYDIMMFAENPTDSLRDSITRKFGTDTKRQDRIENMAAIIYGWILRAEQKWWQHPRWHVHHWKLNFGPTQNLKRWLFSRCNKCGGKFKFGESPCTNSWDSHGPRWFFSEPDIYHMECSGQSIVANEEAP